MKSDLDDQLFVIFPSTKEPHAPITDTVTRREFLGRMDGTSAAEQLKQAGPGVRVVTILETEALHQWLITRTENVA